MIDRPETTAPLLAPKHQMLDMDKPTVSAIVADLVDEQRSLDAVVAALSAEEWEKPTPSPGWAVRDQIGHLSYFDRTASLAIGDPHRFITHREQFVATTFASAESVDQYTLNESRAMNARELLAHWRSQRDALANAAATCANDARIEWYGPSMSPRSFLTARLMECWAHGQDICDAINAKREGTDRLRHIAQLGFMTRRWTYFNRRLNVPEGQIRVELAAPSGVTWAWGPDSADATISGPALDFCLVTSQRRNATDTELVVEGAIAFDWLSKAQLFAGPPTDPPPAQR